MGLQPPSPYVIFPTGEYVIRNAMTGTVMDVNSQDLVVGNIMGGQTRITDQTWKLSSTTSGYTLMNKRTQKYVTLEEQSSERSILKATQDEAHASKFYISPSYPNPVQEGETTVVTYQIFVTESQNMVVDLSGGLSDANIQVLAYKNSMTKNSQGGRNQAWYFEAM
ncbi:hypothetical protein AX17_004656 [Amanita inopinata Kibby_2008]|nr:hypothetical protein AX17_004656 [Amanita inopinata Kibby_2008]